MRRGPRAGPPWWVATLTAAGALVAAVLGGPVAAAVVVALGGQAAWASRRWPEVERTARAVATRTVPTALGWLVVVVALDAGAGFLWDRVTGEEEVADDIEVLVGVDLPPGDDPRADVPAYAGQDWVDRYFAELATLRYGYVPFVGPRVEGVIGRYINSHDGVRRSYQPPGAEGAEALEVWFFGGSTMWGEGQRDLHTIPSEVARQAEADGVTLRVVNYGERGYTAFQGFLLFEQEVAEHGPPDLVVFYDGQNELGTQQETPENLSAQPTVYQLATYLDALDRAPALPGAAAPAEPSLATDYRETSAVHKLLRRLGIDPADAQEAVDRDALVDNAAEIYRRSVALIRDRARREGVPVVNYWQPGRADDDVYRAIAARRPPGVVDLAGAFDAAGDEERVYIDGGHTNELGAELVARAVWADLGPRIESTAAR